VEVHGVLVLDVFVDEARRACSMSSGVLDRMQSAFSDLCQRLILPLDWGIVRQGLTWFKPAARTNSLKSWAMNWRPIDDLGLDFRMLFQGARETDLTRSLLLTRALPCLSAVYLARLPLAWFHVSQAQLVADDGAVEHQ
jgi:hypothetical protein